MSSPFISEGKLENKFKPLHLTSQPVSESNKRSEMDKTPRFRITGEMAHTTKELLFKKIDVPFIDKQTKHANEEIYLKFLQFKQQKTTEIEQKLRT